MNKKSTPGHMSHEEAIIREFFLPQRRERYLEILSKPKRRPDITHEFDRFKHLDPRRVVPIPPNFQNPNDIFRMLKQKGAPDNCRGFSDWQELDAKTLPLSDALQMIVGARMGAFLSCIPGQLAYFENEDLRCLLESQRKQ